MAVLHHIPFPDGIQNLARILKPGGYAAILEPVAYSKALQRIRDILPIAKDVSPDERQLGQNDIECIKSRFDVINVRHFYLFHRLRRLFTLGKSSIIDHILQTIDRLFLALPGIGHFAGTIVLQVRKKL